jgi:serine/threonine protein kinase
MMLGEEIMIDRVGKQLGNYRLLRLLGRGGFAQVYLGEHIYLKSQAAIKVLHTQLSHEDMQSFLGEARTLVHLVHPHIVRVLEFGVENETPFLVMDYAPNGTLRQRHPKGSHLPLPPIVEYVRQVADALDYAHTQKLVHRDIKPENMLLGRQNEILLTDFGIATIAQSSRYQGAQDMAGTIAYMAPEQVQAHARPASDQYAMGVVVYEWLCGERPFYGSFTEVAAKHAFVPPPPLREREPAIPPEVEQVVMIALQKDPKKRFASIKAFAVALEQACHPTMARPAGFYSVGTIPHVSPAPGTITPSQFPQPSAYALSAQSYSVITPSTHTPPLPPSLSSPGFLPPPSTRILSTESCTQWDGQPGPLRAKKLILACLFIACTIMAGLVLSALFPLMSVHTHTSPTHYL